MAKSSITLPQFTVTAEFASKLLSATTQKLYPKGVLASSFTRAWDAGYTGKGITVAILDTGIDGNHPDLKDKVIKSINLTGEGLSESHGTHVAGTIAANGWLVGGAPDASIIDIKVLGRLGGSISNVVNGISLAVSNGATIINMSLGSSALGQSDIQRLIGAINYAWNNGVICIAAAGNDGKSICSPDPLSYPASVQRAESIAACDIGDDLNNITLASFSNENASVDLAACGRNVVSSVLNGKYAIFNGTSMATPHVSAMAAVLAQFIRSKYPDLKGSSFSAALASMIHANVLQIPGCGVNSRVMVNGKILAQHIVQQNCIAKSQFETPLKAEYENISFGLGFLRYEPDKGPVIPNGEKFYYNGIFLGHQVTV